MILSAMIFAGVTAVVGFLIGYLIGQARSRMSYEEDLRKEEEGRALLERELAQLRNSLPLKSQAPRQPSGAGASNDPVE